MTDISKEVLYNQVRIKTSKSGGSGTVIYSRQGPDNFFSTYILTCHHVIDDVIHVEDKWIPMLGKNRKVESREPVVVEFFNWKAVPHGKSPLTSGVRAEVVAYDHQQDMALVHLKLSEPPSVARLYPPNLIENLVITTPVKICGCALLHDPILTEGIITHQGDVIDYRAYWMSNAQIIFGNSGGSVFTPINGQYEFIGIPSRVDVTGWGMAVTHLGYFSPITRVYEFFKDEIFDFLTPGSTKTEEECAAERKKKKEEEDRKLQLPAD